MKNWQENIIQEVWEKGIEVSGVDSKLWRKDIAGAWMSRRLYGKKFSEYGWEIDHIKLEKGIEDQFIDDDTRNLQPLQWENNLSKANNYPCFTTLKTADVISNIKKVQYWSYRLYSVGLSYRHTINKVANYSLLQA
jgi:hypothetical protein